MKFPKKYLSVDNTVSTITNNNSYSSMPKWWNNIVTSTTEGQGSSYTTTLKGNQLTTGTTVSWDYIATSGTFTKLITSESASGSGTFRSSIEWDVDNEDKEILTTTVRYAQKATGYYEYDEYEKTINVTTNGIGGNFSCYTDGDQFTDYNTTTSRVTAIKSNNPYYSSWCVSYEESFIKKGDERFRDILVSTTMNHFWEEEHNYTSTSVDISVDEPGVVSSTDLYGRLLLVSTSTNLDGSTRYADFASDVNCTPFVTLQGAHDSVTISYDYMYFNSEMHTTSQVVSGVTLTEIYPPVLPRYKTTFDGRLGGDYSYNDISISCDAAISRSSTIGDSIYVVATSTAQDHNWVTVSGTGNSITGTAELYCENGREGVAGYAHLSYVTTNIEFCDFHVSTMQMDPPYTECTFTSASYTIYDTESTDKFTVNGPSLGMGGAYIIIKSDRPWSYQSGRMEAYGKEAVGTVTKDITVTFDWYNENTNQYSYPFNIAYTETNYKFVPCYETSIWGNMGGVMDSVNITWDLEDNASVRNSYTYDNGQFFVQLRNSHSNAQWGYNWFTFQPVGPYISGEADVYCELNNTRVPCGVAWATVTTIREATTYTSTMSMESAGYVSFSKSARVSDIFWSNRSSSSEVINGSSARTESTIISNSNAGAYFDTSSRSIIIGTRSSNNYYETLVQFRLSTYLTNPIVMVGFNASVTDSTSVVNNSNDKYYSLSFTNTVACDNKYSITASQGNYVMSGELDLALSALTSNDIRNQFLTEETITSVASYRYTTVTTVKVETWDYMTSNDTMSYMLTTSETTARATSANVISNDVGIGCGMTGWCNTYSYLADAGGAYIPDIGYVPFKVGITDTMAGPLKFAATTQNNGSFYNPKADPNMYYAWEVYSIVDYGTSGKTMLGLYESTSWDKGMWPYQDFGYALVRISKQYSWQQPTEAVVMGTITKRNFRQTNINNNFYSQVVISGGVDEFQTYRSTYTTTKNI